MFATVKGTQAASHDTVHTALQRALSLRKFGDQGLAFTRQMHHGATDELIEDAIRLLSLLEVYGQQGEEIHGPTVATAVQQVVSVLRKAQQHHHEVMPLMPAPWRQGN